MLNDPIVEEVRQIKEELAAGDNYDVHVMFERMRRTQAQFGARLVKQPAHSTSEPVPQPPHERPDDELKHAS